MAIVPDTARRFPTRLALTLAAALAVLPFLAWAMRPGAYLPPAGGLAASPAQALADVLYLSPAFREDALFIAAFVTMALCALTATGLALTILWRGTPGRASLRLVGFLVGGTAFVGLAYLAIPFAAGPYGAAVQGAGRWGWGLTGAAGGAWLASLLKFSVLFPAPLTDDAADHLRKPGRAKRWAFRKVLAFVRSPWSWLVLVAGPGAAAFADPFAGLFLLQQLAMFTLIGAYLFLKLGRTVADEEDRRRIDVVFVGFNAAVWSFVLVGILPFALGPLLGDVGYGLYIIVLLGFSPSIVGLCLILGLAAAVLVGGALDPEVALERTTLYGIMGVLFVGAYGAIENLLFEWIESRLALSSTASSLILGGVLAVLMIPLHKRLEPFVERRVGDATGEPDVGAGARDRP